MKRAFVFLMLVGTIAAAAASAVAAQKDGKEAKESSGRPKITLKAQPIISISPSRVTLRAELVGGANDYEDFYCPTIEWDWGDGTQSESRSDCDPYEPGKSEIKRRFTVEHVFRAGNYQVAFRLKRKDKTLVQVTTSLQVQAGAAEFGR